ncbi:hypothetical protein M3E13_00680 [Oceanobacillus kimchii]|nr:hypothetical protein [Oceanobacillus kimchii]MCT2134416.1 hypothetical protein [Oceanobacillus kimchii]
MENGAPIHDGERFIWLAPFVGGLAGGLLGSALFPGPGYYGPPGPPGPPWGYGPYPPGYGPGPYYYDGPYY